MVKDLKIDGRQLKFKKGKYDLNLSVSYSSKTLTVEWNGESYSIPIEPDDNYDVEFDLEEIVERVTDKNFLDKIQEMKPDGYGDKRKKMKKNRIYDAITGEMDIDEAKKEVKKQTKRDSKRSKLQRYLTSKFEKFGDNWSYLTDTDGDKQVVVVKEQRGWGKDVMYYLFVISEDDIRARKTEGGLVTIHDVVKNKDYGKIGRLSELSESDIDKFKDDDQLMLLLKGLSTEIGQKAGKKLTGFFVSKKI